MTLATVIIPVFQDQEGLVTCLKGLARQSLPQDLLQVVVVDNGSIPEISIPADLSRNVSLVTCATPGSYAARNKGAAVAAGKYLAFTDADCIPEADWLVNGIRALQQEDREVIVGGEVKFAPPSMPTMVSLYQMTVGFQQEENIHRKGFSATANLLCCRETFQRVGPFTETLLSGGDREWAWRARRLNIETIFAPDAIVCTPPRSTFTSAARQARRVAAGRYHLRQSGLARDRTEALRPHRGVMDSVIWIASRSDLGLLDRLRVLFAASLLKGVSIFESMRVRLGGPPERR